MPLYTLIVQNAFPPQRLGVVTSATTFFRSIGGTVGVAILGTVVNNRFSSEYPAQLAPQLKDNPQFARFLSNLSPQALISPETITAIQQQLEAAHLPARRSSPRSSPTIQAPIAPALAAATTQAFLIGAIVLAFAIVSTALDPRNRPAQAHRPARPGDGTGRAAPKGWRSS